MNPEKKSFDALDLKAVALLEMMVDRLIEHLKLEEAVPVYICMDFSGTGLYETPRPAERELSGLFKIWNTRVRFRLYAADLSSERVAMEVTFSLPSAGKDVYHGEKGAGIFFFEKNVWRFFGTSLQTNMLGYLAGHQKLFART
ncbi:MAG: hypothetical protein JWL82_202 [Parcubacteria group bacterium]|nr:hypothetical protein [Parcubacteria group bacterium]